MTSDALHLIVLYMRNVRLAPFKSSIRVNRVTSSDNKLVFMGRTLNRYHRQRDTLLLYRKDEYGRYGSSTPVYDAGARFEESPQVVFDAEMTLFGNGLLDIDTGARYEVSHSCHTDVLAAILDGRVTPLTVPAYPDRVLSGSWTFRKLNTSTYLIPAPREAAPRERKARGRGEEAGLLVDDMLGPQA